MAFILFDITSITSLGTVEATAAAGNIHMGSIIVYATKFGELGYWCRLPLCAEPIADCCTTTPVSVDSWGLYYFYGTTSVNAGFGDVGPLIPGGPLKVCNFEKGGRWISIMETSGHTGGQNYGVTAYASPSTSTIGPTLLGVGNEPKYLLFYYRSVKESGKPVTNTL